MSDEKKPIKMQLPDKKTLAKMAQTKGTVVGSGDTPHPGTFSPHPNPHQLNTQLTAVGQTMMASGQPFAKGDTVYFPLTKAGQAIGGGLGITITQPMFFSPIHTPQNWQIASKRREVYQWARFYYENEPKVAAAIDFYSQFPINSFKLECKKKQVLKYFERLVDKLNLLKWLRLISHERFLLGDVFVFLEIECPHCHGTGVDPDNPEEACPHPEGSFKRIIILNPDWIEVYTTVLADEPEIVLLPDDELKKIVQTKQPRPIYERLPDAVKALVAAGRPIRLSNTVTSHIRHGGAPYGTYGESILRRLFTTLAYKTKLMTANWIVAERLILPVRVVKVGEKERPASEDDIADITQQLAAVANDPNLTIVTHHAFEYEWYGACYDNLTEILTPEGWKFFNELSKDAIVATYNAQCGEMQWQQIDEYHEYDFKSTDTLKMYNFKAKGVDICVTPNHRMLVERNGQMREVYSQEVKHGDKFLSTVGWRGRVPSVLPYQNGPLSHLTLDDYLEFAGYYLSEGGVKRETKRGLSPEKQIQACSVGQNRSSPIYSSMKEVVGLVYPNFSEAEDDRANDVFCNFTINSVKIARYMAEEFGSRSEEKKIPRWIRDLPKEKLQIVYDAMMAGDGCIRDDRRKSRYMYTTTSRNLADHFSEIALKLGYFTSTSTEAAKNERCRDLYRIYWSEWKKETPFEIRQQHISRSEYDGKVYCVKVPNTWIITRRNGKITVQGNTGKIHNITAEMELIGKEILDGLMLNQALLNGEMGAYASAQIGAETMIMRLDTWRAELKDWVEKNIFLPVAKMRGFIDEEESKELGEVVYLYPTLKWEDMRLRDNTNDKQMAIQLNQNGKISDRTLLERYFDLNYDQEIEQMREEQVMAMQNGMLQGGGPGGMGGMGAPGGGAAGGMGGPAGPGGPPMGGDPMGGGMGGPMGGPGGMPGGAPMGGGAGGAGGGPMGAAAGGPMPGKVYKKGKAPKPQEPSPEELAAMMPVPIRLTKPEAKLWRLIQNMRLPFSVFAQYKQQIPGQPQPFAMDFAMPELRLDIEADGEQWHNNPEDKQSDNERDLKLANLGWTVIRFPESAINENIQQVQKVLEENIMEAAKHAKMRKKSMAQGSPTFKVVYYDEKPGLAESIEAGYTSILKTQMVVQEREIKEG